MKADKTNPYQAFRELVRRTTQALYPGIGRYDRVVYGRVTKVFSSSGRVTVGSKLWSVDVELLDRNLEPDSSRGIIRDVPVDPFELSRDGRALFPVVFTGLVVRLGWMYADRSLPYIVSITAEGQRLPYTSDGQMSALIAEALQLLANLRDSAAGPVAMRANDLIRLQQIIAALPSEAQ